VPGKRTDTRGILSLIFGSLSVVCMLLGFFTCGLSFVAATLLAVAGAGLGFFSRGNLRVAGLTLNFLALVPAIVFLCLSRPEGTLSSTPSASPTSMTPQQQAFYNVVRSNAEDPSGFRILHWGQRNGDNRTVKFQCNVICHHEGKPITSMEVTVRYSGGRILWIYNSTILLIDWRFY
jgi:hypothetical protein